MQKNSDVFPFNLLPHELKVHTFKFLANIQEINNLSVINKEFKFLNSDTNLWRFLLKKDFNAELPKGEPGKEYYKKLYRELQILLLSCVIIDLSNKYESSPLNNLLNEPSTLSLAKIKAIAKAKGIEEIEIDSSLAEYRNTINKMLLSTEAMTEKEMSGALIFCHLNNDHLMEIINDELVTKDTFTNMPADEIKKVQQVTLQILKDEQKNIRKFFELFAYLFTSNANSIMKLIFDKHPGIINLDLSQRYGTSFLNDAIMTLNLPWVKFLLEKGAKVNNKRSMCIFAEKDSYSIHPDTESATPLYCAVVMTFFRKNFANGKEIIKLLLEQGAKPDLSCSDLEGIGSDSPINFCKRNYTRPDVDDEMRKIFDIILDWDPALKMEAMNADNSSDQIREILGLRI